MITQFLSYEHDGNKAIKTAAKILKKGGLVAIPTETVYGLAANALDKKAVANIFKAKGRPQDNPLIVHIADYDDIMHLADYIPFTLMQLAKAFWPGPLTMIIPKSEKIPDIVSGGLNTVAVRMPSHPVARKVIREAGIPLAAPSANISGSPSPTTAHHVMHDLNGRIDAVLDGGECDVGVESTVISLADDKPILLRPGIITLEQLSEVIGHIDVSEAVINKLNDNKSAPSPGMKYKHYSPKTKIIMIKTENDEDFIDYVNSMKDKNCGVLCYDNETEIFKIPSVTYGQKGDYDSQAHELFDALRKVDDLSVQTVYVRCPVPQGVGLAVYNRLIRAAGFEVITI